MPMLTRLNTFPTIHNHFCPVDESPLITGNIQTHISHIVRLRQSTQRHIAKELLPVLRCVR